MTIPQIIVPAYIAVGVWFMLIEWPAFAKQSSTLKSLEWEYLPRAMNITTVIVCEIILLVVILATWPYVAIHRTYLRITTGKWTKHSPDSND